MAKLKAFVRFDGTGTIVPSSIVLAKSKPKVGKWIEIDAYECCNSTTTTTTSNTLCRQFRINGSGNTIWEGIGCDGLPYSTGISLPEDQQLFYCAQSITSSNKTFEDIGVCGASCKTWLVSGTSVESYPATIDYYDCEGVPDSIIINEPTEICGLYITPASGIIIAEIGSC
tara:strand:+ start:110 stop:622 length:513 start_codon:yes stop_codon:yes gene_type:complete